ncbi:MAG TPA: class I SAM-dependent methyltransferase [Candidatus Nanoarchaeia archaeon]|nr:class I SAM-dependent methyltransferase [Candidatus Nanoarchaeia archaeon]
MDKWGKKRSVIRRYNLTAQMYDERYCEEQEAKYRAALASMNLTFDSIMLDVGCGSGMFFDQVADRARIVVGLDVSRELLSLAKDRAKKLRNAFLVLADADHLPFKTGVFNYFFAFTVLQNMPSPVETIKELQVSASPNASFVITGLRAAISLEKFNWILRKAGLKTVSIRDDEAIKCYIAVAVQSQN